MGLASLLLRHLATQFLERATQAFGFCLRLLPRLLGLLLGLLGLFAGLTLLLFRLLGPLLGLFGLLAGLPLLLLRPLGPLGPLLLDNLRRAKPLPGHGVVQLQLLAVAFQMQSQHPTGQT